MPRTVAARGMEVCGAGGIFSLFSSSSSSKSCVERWRGGFLGGFDFLLSLLAEVGRGWGDVEFAWRIGGGYFHLIAWDWGREEDDDQSMMGLDSGRSRVIEKGRERRARLSNRLKVSIDVIGGSVGEVG